MKGKGEVLQIGAPHNDSSGWGDHMEDAFGTSSEAFSKMAVAALASLLGGTTETLDPTQLNAMLAAVDGMQPANEAETMLAIQMAGTHRVAMDMMRRVPTAQTREAAQEYGTLATKLLRTYTTQIEAFAKIRRGGNQRVRVEHVHVYEGGQAIVGSVTQGEGRGGVVLKMASNLMDRTVRLSNMRQAPRCGAKTKSGKPCECPARKGRKRCRIHGEADGSGAPEGQRNGAWRHGLYSKEHLAMKRLLRELIAESRDVAALF